MICKIKQNNGLDIESRDKLAMSNDQCSHTSYSHHCCLNSSLLSHVLISQDHETLASLYLTLGKTILINVHNIGSGCEKKILDFGIRTLSRAWFTRVIEASSHMNKIQHVDNGFIYLADRLILSPYKSNKQMVQTLIRQLHKGFADLDQHGLQKTYRFLFDMIKIALNRMCATCLYQHGESSKKKRGHAV